MSASIARKRAVTASAITATVLLGLTGVTGVSEAEAASGAVVSNRVCQSQEEGTFRGFCVTGVVKGKRFTTWLGTFTTRDGKQEFVCLDWLFGASQSPINRKLIQPLTKNRLGQKIDPATAQALSRMMQLFAPDGSPNDNVTAAAVALISREAMGDGTHGGRTVFPKITVKQQVKKPGVGVPTQVLSRARQIWAKSTAERGAYKITVTVDHKGSLDPGKTYTARAQVRSATGRLVSGVPIKWSIDGATRDASTSFTTSSGTATARFRSGANKTVTVKAQAAVAAGVRVYVPKAFRQYKPGMNLRTLEQRKLIGSKTAIAAKATAPIRVLPATPNEPKTPVITPETPKTPDQPVVNNQPQQVRFVYRMHGIGCVPTGEIQRWHVRVTRPVQIGTYTEYADGDAWWEDDANGESHQVIRPGAEGIVYPEMGWQSVSPWLDAPVVAKGYDDCPANDAPVEEWDAWEALHDGKRLPVIESTWDSGYIFDSAAIKPGDGFQLVDNSGDYWNAEPTDDADTITYDASTRTTTVIRNYYST